MIINKLVNVGTKEHPNMVAQNVEVPDEPLQEVITEESGLTAIKEAVANATTIKGLREAMLMLLEEQK